LILAFDRSRYPVDYLRAGYSEENIQPLIVARLRQLRCWVHVVDAGAKTLRGRAFGALRRAGASTVAVQYGSAGSDATIPDLIGIAPDGRPLFIECKRPEHLARSPKTGALVQKRPAGEPTERQVSFLLEAERRGAVAGVAWAALDCDAILAASRRAA
jgi:hypothetical protein